jgi:hypothetical protein
MGLRRILITVSVEAGHEVDSKDARENRNEYFIMIPADRAVAAPNRVLATPFAAAVDLAS